MGVSYVTQGSSCGRYGYKVEGAMRMMKEAIDLAYAIGAPATPSYSAAQHGASGYRSRKGHTR
jgi:hypothetical protein